MPDEYESVARTSPSLLRSFQCLDESSGVFLGPHSNTFSLSFTVAENAESVGYGGVRVGANQCIGIDNAHCLLFVTFRNDQFGQIFKIDLLAHADARWNDGQPFENGRTPLERRRDVGCHSSVHIAGTLTFMKRSFSMLRSNSSC